MVSSSIISGDNAFENYQKHMDDKKTPFEWQSELNKAVAELERTKILNGLLCKGTVTVEEAYLLNMHYSDSHVRQLEHRLESIKKRMEERGIKVNHDT